MPPRQEQHNLDTKTEQRPPILDQREEGDDIILVDPDLAAKDYLDDLAFMTEPVTIRLQPSTDKNAATAFPVWVNGKPAETFWNGKWTETGWLPVSKTLVVRRSVLEVILRAKIDTVNTQMQGADEPDNRILRFTTPIHSVSILEDRNPKGPAWVSEMTRRNY